MHGQLHARRGRDRSLLRSYEDSVGNFISRRRSEAALGAARMEAELANRAKTDFLANMSHELRTPLNAIIGFSQVLSQPAPKAFSEEKWREYAVYIENAGNHLLGIISDILDMSKIESDQIELDLAPHRIGELLSPCVTMLRDRIAARGQVLDVRVSAVMPQIKVDARRFKQIVINLLSNANKFTADGGLISVHATRGLDGRVNVTVTDTGIGMNAEQLATALKPFGQVQGALSRAHEGTGLGLPIAKKLTELQGGTFTIESEPGTGTRITLSFPSHFVRLTPPAAPPPPPAKATP
ncbi:MAG: HAMP domain-containing histidine kinase [Alphaproteobacteria bacterium]|nr:HAMP domain-containing histidine kinase [Alphaproteobacteria bacterium]